jgi:hypothetical protein
MVELWRIPGLIALALAAAIFFIVSIYALESDKRSGAWGMVRQVAPTKKHAATQLILSLAVIFALAFVRLNLVEVVGPAFPFSTAWAVRGDDSCRARQAQELSWWRDRAFDRGALSGTTPCWRI